MNVSGVIFFLSRAKETKKQKKKTPDLRLPPSRNASRDILPRLREDWELVRALANH